jgi:hypothetical protein
MDEERVQETDEGYYVQSGDVLEWKWKSGPTTHATPSPKPEPEKPTRRAKKAAKK